MRSMVPLLAVEVIPWISNNLRTQNILSRLSVNRGVSPACPTETHLQMGKCAIKSGHRPARLNLPQFRQSSSPADKPLAE